MLPTYKKILLSTRGSTLMTTSPFMIFLNNWELILKYQHILLKVLSDGIHSLLGQFTDLTFSREENKNKVIRCGFFNLSNGIFWVLYEKFDWIILKIWSLLLFSQSVRELMGDWKEGLVNRPWREWAPSDNILGIAIREIF